MIFRQQLFHQFNRSERTSFVLCLFPRKEYRLLLRCIVDLFGCRRYLLFFEGDAFWSTLSLLFHAILALSSRHGSDYMSGSVFC